MQLIGMCTTRILAQTEMGFVNQCADCRTIHLAFGTAIVSLSENDFADFCAQVSTDVAYIDQHMDRRVKSIQIAHPSKSGLALVLSVCELLQLQDLLAPAQFLLTAYNLIRDDETLH